MSGHIHCMDETTCIDMTITICIDKTICTHKKICTSEMKMLLGAKAIQVLVHYMYIILMGQHAQMGWRCS